MSKWLPQHIGNEGQKRCENIPAVKATRLIAELDVRGPERREGKRKNRRLNLGF